MTENKEAKRVKEIIKKLDEMYPNAGTELKYQTTFQLLVAVILSAQCTDKQVNKITANLFNKYREPEDFARLEWRQLSKEIKSCGLFRNKSKNIIAASRILVEKYNSQVPRDREKLESLPGVGRKTANVILNVAFDKPAIPVDTHVFRVSRRLGLTFGKTPEAVEKDLMLIVPPEKTKRFPHCLIFHGRQVCQARNPRCEQCLLFDLCPRNGLGENTVK